MGDCKPSSAKPKTSIPKNLGRAAGARELDSGEFLAEVGRAMGIKKDVEAFKQRWILGRGCPRISAAFTYSRHAKRHVLLTEL